ncbi:MAG TPA: lipid II flippase MurJ [Vicinamibacteria bacterium]|nr:lipid II flippase MurJ [Vicinamibacteria bacterium]
MTEETARSAREADEATRGSAIKLAAEVASRLLGLGTTLLLARALGLAGFGAFGGLWYLALVLAEAAEFGLQATATRALVAGTLSLRAVARARLFTSGLVAGVTLAALAVAPAGPAWAREALPVLAPLVLFFVLAGWAEFLGVALRCRGARVEEALLLLVLRAGSPAGAAAAILAGGGLSGIAWSQAASPLPALLLGVVLLARRAVPSPGADADVASVLRAAVPMAANGGLQMLSPRVELLVLWILASDRETGVFLAALRVFEFLGMVPNAVAQGAMPALTREALRGGSGSRQRTAGLMALVAAPAAVGLSLVAASVVRLLYGPAYLEAATPLRLLAAGLLPLFMNALLSWALLARGRASWLPRLTAVRVAAAAVLATSLVPPLGAVGAAIGLASAEWLLLGLGWMACRRAAFAVPVAVPAGGALLACVPMALAVSGLRDRLPFAVAVGGLTWAATLALALRLRPALARELIGGLPFSSGAVARES